MKNLVKNNVSQIVLEYLDFSNKTATVEISEWGNFEGFTIALDTLSGIQCFSITHDDWNAIQMAMSAMGVTEPREE